MYNCASIPRDANTRIPSAAEGNEAVWQNVRFLELLTRGEILRTRTCPSPSSPLLMPGIEIAATATAEAPAICRNCLRLIAFILSCLSHTAMNGARYIILNCCYVPPHIPIPIASNKGIGNQPLNIIPGLLTFQVNI